MPRPGFDKLNNTCFADSIERGNRIGKEYKKLAIKIEMDL
jgi:hypothetical protein